MSQIQLFDRLALYEPKITKDGYLAVRAAAARTGIYEYRAGEVGAPADRFAADSIVRVYRAPEDVFAVDSMQSFIGRPITDDHPAVAVTADNWKRHARGTVMAAARKTAQDGDYLTFDLVLMDKAAIDKVNNGKRELSNGYNCQLDWTPGVTADGQRYDARQINIVGNHVALVDRGRAGDKCRIGDGVRSDPVQCTANLDLVADIQSNAEARMKLTNLDGLTVNLQDSTAVEQALSVLDKKLTAESGKVADLEKQLADAAGEKAALTQQLADAKASLEPAKIDQLVADRAELVQVATKVVDGFTAAGLSNDQIRRKVVEAKLGDKATDMVDAEVAGAFRMIAAALPTDDAKPTHKADLRDTVPSAIKTTLISDNASALAVMRANRHG